MIGSENLKLWQEKSSLVNEKTRAVVCCIHQESGEITTFTMGDVLSLNGLAHLLSGAVDRTTAAETTSVPIKTEPPSKASKASKARQGRR